MVPSSLVFEISTAFPTVHVLKKGQAHIRLLCFDRGVTRFEAYRISHLLLFAAHGEGKICDLTQILFCKWTVKGKLIKACFKKVRWCIISLHTLLFCVA